MNVQDILDDINDHGFTDTSTTRKLAVVNETYQDACGREPWPFLETGIDLNYSGSSGVATNMPTNFSAMTTMWRKSDGWSLRVYRLDDFYDEFASNATLVGDPMLVFFEAGIPVVYPAPLVANAVITMKYLRIPTDLLSTDVASAILLPAQYHRGVLVNGALEKLYAMEDDTDLAAWFERKYEKSMDKMRSDLWRFQYNTPEYIHPVTEPYPESY